MCSRRAHRGPVTPTNTPRTRSRRANGARDFLERLIHEYPTDTRLDAARYDLALIARSFGLHERARELLDALIATGSDENLKAAAVVCARR